jgi:hypothetical protein
MTSLTPESRNAEVANDAMQEGLMNGLMTLIPTTGLVYAAVQYSPKIRSITNMQSRTALCIMPALFVFAFTAEEKVVHSMRQMAKENQHAHDSVTWAERQLTSNESAQQQQEINELYRRAVYESGVRVIPGTQLQFHHIAANYVQENPFKVLTALAVPGVAWIFYGRAGQEHLTFSMKVMHTRVFGQFATISTLLGVMGFKNFMDQRGKFITEDEAETRVEEMKELRTQMLQRLDESNKAKQAYQDAIQKAHDQDIKEGHGAAHNKKVHHHQKKQQQHPKSSEHVTTMV